MSGDLSIKLRILLEQGGTAGRLAGLAGRLAGLGREIDTIKTKSRASTGEIRAGVQSISAQLERMQRLAQGGFLIFQGAGVVGGIGSSPRVRGTRRGEIAHPLRQLGERLPDLAIVEFGRVRCGPSQRAISVC
ncbi:MAG: hypothetical protein AMXMBFR6_08410 [Betaproteobacteria bacterium]